MHRSPLPPCRLVALFVVAVATASTARPVFAAATEIRCPSTLVQAPTPQSVPSDWIVRGAPDELSLQRAAFYNGDPGGLGTLAPDSTHRSGTTETSTWNFSGDGSAAIWIGCLYRDGTAVVAQPLPPGVRRCTTRTRVTPMGDPAGLLSVTCN
jgi:hypothetical protein